MPEYAIILHSAETGMSIESMKFKRLGVLLGRGVTENSQEVYDVEWMASPGFFEDNGEEFHTFTIV
jgi:hypothetical protein